MASQPTFPYPYMDTIDVNAVEGNTFKCLINSKDTVLDANICVLQAKNNPYYLKYSGSVHSSMLDSKGYFTINYDEELYTTINYGLSVGYKYYAKVEDERGLSVNGRISSIVLYEDSLGDLYIRVYIHEWFGSTPKTYKIYTDSPVEIKVPVDNFPLLGGYGDASWLQCNLPNNILANGVDYKWFANIKYEEQSKLCFGSFVSANINNNHYLSIVFDHPYNGESLNNDIEYYIVVNSEKKRVYDIREIEYTDLAGKSVSGTEVNLYNQPDGYENTLFTTPIEIGDACVVYAEQTIAKSPEYYFKARTTPVVTFNVSDKITSCSYEFSAKYEQEQKTKIAYYEFELYKDSELIDSTGQCFTQNISYVYNGLLNGESYSVKLTIVNEDGVEIIEEREFSVDYEVPKSEVFAEIFTDKQDSCISINLNNVEDSNAVRYFVQRHEVDYEKLYDVATVENDCSVVYDFNIRNNKSYQYRIYPIYVNNGAEVFGVPISTNTLYTDFYGWSIVGTKATEVNNEYVVDNDNIWSFGYNISANPIKPVYNKNYVTGFGQFPKLVQGDENYLEGGLSCLIGDVACNGKYINDNIDSIKKWRAFCNNGELKLLKDLKGHIIPCSIKDTTPTIDYSIIEKPTTISFNFVQLMDRENISVYGLKSV